MAGNSNTRWQKGVSGNPTGRPSAARAELLAVLEKVGTKKGKTFLEHFVERAFSDNQVAIALAKKILPDLSQGDFGDETIKGFVDVIRAAARARNNPAE